MKKQGIKVKNFIKSLLIVFTIAMSLLIGLEFVLAFLIFISFIYLLFSSRKILYSFIIIITLFFVLINSIVLETDKISGDFKVTKYFHGYGEYVEICKIKENSKEYKKLIRILNDEKYFWSITIVTYIPEVLIKSKNLNINMMNEKHLIARYESDYFGSIRIKKEIPYKIKNLCPDYNEKKIIDNLKLIKDVF